MPWSLIGSTLLGALCAQLQSSTEGTVLLEEEQFGRCSY